MNTQKLNKENADIEAQQLIVKINTEYKKTYTEDIEVLFLMSAPSCKKYIIDLGREKEFIADMVNFIKNNVPQERSDFFTAPLESEELKDKFGMDFKIYIRKSNTNNAWGLL